jgi:hypothetical protein
MYSFHHTLYNPSSLVLRERLQVLNLFLGADEQRHPLVHLGGLHIHNAHLPCAAEASCLLCDERHWGALVEKPEFASGVLAVSRIPIDASV